jgi:hypothetical protein
MEQMGEAKKLPEKGQRKLLRTSDWHLTVLI